MIINQGCFLVIIELRLHFFKNLIKSFHNVCLLVYCLL